MQVAANLTLTADDKKQLAGILQCKVSELEDTLGPYADAAVREYVQMFLGQRVFTRGSDMREFRLFLLIRTAFKDTLPDEQTVCDLFQCTLTQSRSLIRSVMSKYQYDLHGAITTSLKSTVEGAIADPDGYGVEATINNENIVEALDRVLASLDGTLPQVQKKRGTVSTYQLKASSYLRLCEHFKIKTPVIKTNG